jgi:hypothetical protein
MDNFEEVLSISSRNMTFPLSIFSSSTLFINEMVGDAAPKLKIFSAIFPASSRSFCVNPNLLLFQNLLRPAISLNNLKLSQN